MRLCSGVGRGGGCVLAVVMGESFVWASTASGLVLPCLQSTCKLHSRQDVALASLLLSVTDAEWYSPPAKAKTS